MNASKENCREAMKRLDNLSVTDEDQGSDWDFIKAFLKAAERKLPYERSFPTKRDVLVTNQEGDIQSGG